MPPLALPRPEHDEAIPYKGDLLQREALARRLTGYIDRLKAGAVIAIDAPWGEGKTWFGKNWAADLKVQEHKVVFIDAFQQDYIEDPFLLIAAEISSVLDDGQGSATELRKKAVGVMRAILPVGTKALINLAGRMAFGSANLSDEFKDAAEAAQDGVADAAEKWMEKKLEDYANEKTSLDNFRIALTEFAAKQDKPVVVFIDELDRCNPVFAVRLIERIKHFFEVPNLVFVLLLNREQLEKAVKGKYGAEVDASAYLGKFVHFFLRLPKAQVSAHTGINKRLINYCEHVMQNYGQATNNQMVNVFVETLAFWSTQFGLSLRDIEKAFALYMLSNRVHAMRLLAYLIALKIKKPDVFYGILKSDQIAHKKQITEFEKIIAAMHDEVGVVRGEYQVVQELHRRAIGIAPNEALSQEIRRFIDMGRYNSLGEAFVYIAGSIDIPLEL